LVFLGSKGVASITDTTTATRYDTPAVGLIGPRRVDIDADGREEVPFTDGDVVSVTDDNNETEGFSNTSAATGAGTGNLWAGSFDGDPNSVYFSGSNNNNLKRVDADGNVFSVVTSEQQLAVGGVGDVDPAATGEELVYTDGGQFAYKRESGTTEKFGDLSPGNGVAIGQPADFDGDGTARVPFVDGSGNLKLLNLSSKKATELSTGEAVDKTPLATLDYDGDTNLEVMYLNTASPAKVKYIDGLENGGTGTARSATDGNGDEIATDRPNRGVA
jgi:hypothetical protein